MRSRRSKRILVLSLLSLGLALPLSGCVTTASHFCTKGGQPAFDDGRVNKGTKQCVQVRDGKGGYVNHGQYIEWHVNGQRALEGEYASGLKTGKWMEWDEKGRKIGEKWYDYGQVVPGREEHPYNGLGPPPRPMARAEPSPLPTAAPKLVPLAPGHAAPIPAAKPVERLESTPANAKTF